MIDFIKTQYKLYTLGQNSIGIEKIKTLARLYLSPSEYGELFKERENIEE